MATRRVYKPRKGYRDGGRVLGDDADAPMPEASADAPPPPASPSIPPAQASDAILRALEATRRAEAMARQAVAPPSTIDEHIARLPVSEHKKRFLREHPDVLTDTRLSNAMSHHYSAAIARGVVDDSAEMDQAILAGLRGEIERREPSIEHAARGLDLEAAAMRMSAATQSPIAADMPAPAPRRSSIPMAAPVSRDVPSASGRRMSDMRSITLTAEERDIARRSYSAPDMTDDAKERAYAAAKSVMLARRAAGTLNE